jgi:entericidin B
LHERQLPRVRPETAQKNFRRETMFAKTASHIVIVAAVAAFAAGCANTIRGVGADTAQAVDATQQAGQNIERSARR